MSKNIYDILNDSSINLDELNKDGFNDIEKKKIKDNFKKSLNGNMKNRNHKNIIAASLAGILFIGFLGTNAGAAVVNNIRMASYDIASFLGITKDLAPYTTVVDKTLSNDKLSIQLNEVIFDGDELVVSSTISIVDPSLKKQGVYPNEKVFINGKSIVTSSSGGGEIIDNSIHKNITTYRFGDNTLTGDIDVKIVYDNILINDEVEGIKPIIFEFTTNADELSSNTKEVELDNTFILGNGTELSLNKYKSNPLKSKIYYSTNCKGNYEILYRLKLVGKDNEGNEIIFSGGSGDMKGGVLELDNVIGSGISETATSVTLKVLAAPFYVETQIRDPNFVEVGEEFTIQLN